MSGSAAPLAPSTSSSATSIASATARTESAGLQRQVKPMRPWYGSPAFFGTPDHPQAGPVLVDRGHLDVDQPEGQGELADDGVGDVAAVAGRPARPGDPERPGRIDPPGELADLHGDLARFGEEGEDDVGLAVRAGPCQPGRRVGQRPSARRVMQVHPVPGLEPQLGRLRPARVPRRRHRPPADGFAVPGMSTSDTGLMNIIRIRRADPGLPAGGGNAAPPPSNVGATWYLHRGDPGRVALARLQ